jgi:FkbH-like protein
VAPASGAGPGSVLQQIQAAPADGLSAAAYMTLARGLKDDPEARERLKPARLVLLSSFTTTLLDPYVKVEAARQGFLVDTHHGGFGQFEQALLGDEWRAKDGATEVLVVAMRLEDLDPDLPFRVRTEPVDAFDVLATNVLGRVDAILSIFRGKSKGPVLVANFAVPEPRVAAVFDANQASSLPYRIQALNRQLLERVSAQAGCYVWDYAGLVSSVGSARFTDPRLWALARNPISTANQPLCARHLARTLRGALRPAAKCLVLDLDNTLWGGVIGDDGVEGIHLGDDHPGKAFKDFQRAVLGLRDRGILLAMSSKNNEAVVHEALAKHPEMLVTLKDFAATRINWNPKSKNLRELAEELNIGADSLVFFDDNPVERAEVREGAPEVQVIEVPADPIQYVRALSEFAGFDMPNVTSEDRMRAQSYEAQIERKQLETKAGSLDEFLTSLEMQVDIGPMNPLTAQRIAQLVGKTNQFNTTTRRTSQAELEAMQAKGHGVYWLRMADRYGDMGLIAVGVLQAEGADGVVHSLVLSCRAANRGMEEAMLAHLAQKARALGCTRLIGEYIPTAKNSVIAELYPRLGFEQPSVVDGVTRYHLDLATKELVSPAFLRIREDVT